MLLNILQIILFQAIFLLIYALWFRKETFYSFNRIYLMGTSFVAVLVPFISITIAAESKISSQIIALGEVV